MGLQRVGHDWATFTFTFHFQPTGTYCTAHGTLLHVMWQPGCERVWERMDTCIFVAESLHCSPKTNTTVNWLSVKFSSVTQLCPTLCDPMNRSTPGLPVHHQLPEFNQTHVHRVNDAIQPSHPLLSPSPPAPKPSQHQGLFQWVNSSHELAKVFKFQLQHQSFQWTPRTDLL